MAVVNKCKPTALSSNAWCVKSMFAQGEGTDLAFLPVAEWASLRDRLLNTSSGAETGAPMVLTPKEGSTQQAYIYNAPTVEEGKTLAQVLFPDVTAETPKSGLYFAGNSLIFNPTVGNAVQADGVPYQTSTFSLPIGSNREYDALAQYLQSKAWVGIKLSSDGKSMHVYGGSRGYFPTADTPSEMMFSGNNDAKGQTSVAFEVAKSDYAIEYVSLGADTDNSDAIRELLGAIQDAACMATGVEE